MIQIAILFVLIGWLLYMVADIWEGRCGLMALMLYLDDAMKVLLQNDFIDIGYIDDDGGSEIVRNELEQKCYLKEPVDEDWREKQMDAFITLDNVPDWQIGKEVTVYFPDTMQKRGICKRYNQLQYNGIKYDRCNSCGSLINSVDNAVACGRCGSPVNWNG